ncbi:cupin domain-containing protein [Gordonia sp. NPDC003424]
MDYLRHFDPSGLDQDVFDYQVLADLESCLVVGCRAPAHGEGFQRHRHPASDQVYYILSGSMQLELESTEYTVGADTAVVIPAGAGHRNWYPGDEPEIHLDFLVPPPTRGGPLAEPAPLDGPSTAPGRAPAIRPAEEVQPREVVPGFEARLMLAPDLGSPELILVNASVAHGEKDSSGVPWHIHPVDQMYFILEGELTVEVADQSFVARPWDFVVLPAGVPHRNWNATEERERHLAFLVPPTRVGEGLDRFVDFAVRRESLTLPS